MSLWSGPLPSMPDGYHRGLEPRLMAPFVDALFDAVPPRGRCLDLACGPGLVARQLPDDAVGVDGWDEMIAFARALSPARRWICADMEWLPFRDARFDAVYCSHGLLFAQDPEVAMAEARRVGRSYAALVWRNLTTSPAFGALHRALLARTGASPFEDSSMAGETVRRTVRFPSARDFLIAFVEGSSLNESVPRLPASTQQAIVLDLERDLGLGEIAFPVEATLIVR